MSSNNKQLLNYKINYNKEQIITFLCCLKKNKVWLPREILEYIIMFLPHYLDLTPLTLLFNNPLLLNNSLENLSNEVYPLIKQLREDKHKYLALERWIYKTNFEATEEIHKDGNKIGDELSWEQSFVYMLYMTIHH